MKTFTEAICTIYIAGALLVGLDRHDLAAGLMWPVWAYQQLNKSLP